MSTLKGKLAKLIEDAYERQGITIYIDPEKLRRNRMNSVYEDRCCWSIQTSGRMISSWETMTAIVKRKHADLRIERNKIGGYDEIS